MYSFVEIMISIESKAGSGSFAIDNANWLQKKYSGSYL
jgi:hypothetical protein